ncbi:MAG: 5'-3' exonuclease H3TH domain-containing protein [Sandaracinus sp.]
MKVHLVDGTYELFRAYFGAPPATTASGQEVGATRGVLRTLIHLLTAQGATHVGIAFDTVIESFRNELFAGYKTGDGIEAPLKTQFPIVERACEALGVVVWRMIEHEADDALATAAARFAEEPEVEQVVICSPDKDLGQCLVGDRVVRLDRMRNTVMNEAGLREKLGIAPATVPDWLALVGDTADGIPGVARWGEKSASAVLGAYGSLEAIPDDPRAWKVKVRGAEALAASLAAHRQEALLYRTLATLRRDVPLPQRRAEDLAWRGADRELVAAIAAELEDDGLVARIPRWR